MRQQSKLFEGLRSKDLKDLVDPVFTVDQFKSKMGEDKDVVVVGFKVNDKYPAIDLMEFIEKGYNFILDADMSTGEERDGKYQVFVEFERTTKLPQQIKDLLSGVSQLCDCYDWRFRYHRAIASEPASVQTLAEQIPLTPQEYEEKILEFKTQDVEEFFDQGAIDDIILDNDNNLTFVKPFSENLTAQLVDIGDYEDLKDQLPGAIQLDESSRTQTLYLEKYLGNYEIHKIDNRFLIRNKDKAVIIAKNRW